MPTTRPDASSRWPLRWGTTGVYGARSDDELLLEVGTGDRESFATLYDHLAGLVYANIRRVLGDVTRIDPVAEEAFVEVWRQAPRFDPERMAAVAWILELVERLATARVGDDRSRGEAGPAADREAPHRSVRAPSSVRDADVAVFSALAAITEQQQRAIELASVEGYTHHDVAAHLDTSIGTVQTLLRDGLLHLCAGLTSREQPR